jgi:hypothetical protein
MITNFISLALKWLCNKKFMQLNVISAAIVWSIWNNRNNLVFNRKTWISMKQVWGLVLSYMQTYRVRFKDQVRELVDHFEAILIRKMKTLSSDGAAPPLAGYQPGRPPLLHLWVVLMKPI